MQFFRLLLFASLLVSLALAGCNAPKGSRASTASSQDFIVTESAPLAPLSDGEPSMYGEATFNVQSESPGTNKFVPVPFATVKLVGEGNGRDKEGIANKEGERLFLFDDTPERHVGKYGVIVSSEGYADSDIREFSIRRGQQLNMKVTLHKVK